MRTVESENKDAKNHIKPLHRAEEKLGGGNSPQVDLELNESIYFMSW